MTPAVFTDQEQRSKSKQFETMAQLSRHMATNLDLNALLDDVVKSLSRDFEYKYASIFLVDTTETALTLKAVSNAEVISTSSNHLSVPYGNQTIIGQVATTAAPLLVSNTSRLNYDFLNYLPIKTQSELAVPLIAGEQLLGVLDVQSEQPNQYNTDDLLFLQAIAGQLAVAIENSRLVEERDQRMAELATFNQIGMVIAEQRDLDTIILNIVHRVNALFQVEAVSLLLLEKEGLRFVAATGAGANDIKTFTLKPGQGIAWSVVETRQTIRVDNVQADSRHFGDIDSAIDFTTRSLLAVPVQIQDRVLGVIEAMNRLDGRPFTRDDEATLEFIASSVAIAIENARLFSETQRYVERMTGLLDASRAINTLDLQDILNTIVQKVGALLEAEHTVVYLADYDAQQIRAVAVHSTGEMTNVPTPPFYFGEGTVGWVLKHRQSLRINDIAQDSRFIQISPQSNLIVNLVCAPLIVKEEAIGVLEATHKTGGKDFTAEDESLLSTFANQAAIAIYNARLYREKQKQVKALTTLTQTSEAITKATNLDQLLNIVLDSVVSIVGAKIGAIILADAQTQILQMETAYGLDQKAINQFNQLNVPHNVGIFGEAYRSGEIIEIADSDSDPRVFTAAEVAWGLPKSFTIVPLFSRDSFIGIILLNALPDEDGLALLRAVADIAAVAIDKARLFKETNQRLAEVSTLYTLADQMTKVPDLDRIVESSVIILKHALDCSGCCLFLMEKSGDRKVLALKACSGWTEPKQTGPEMDYIIQLAETLITKPYPVYLKNATQTVDFPDLAVRENTGDEQQQGMVQKQIQLGSVMIVPLVVKDELQGALSINDKQPNAFGQAEGRLLTIAAAQISTAIENIRLYGNLEQRAIELEVALKEVEEANRLKSEFVQNVSHELRTPLTFIRAYVELILEGTLGPISQEVRDKLDIVSGKTEAITRLVEDIMSLQKIESGNLKVELTTPYELITRATHGANAGAAEYGIEIVSKSAPNLPKVQVDVGRIGQVFDNLVGNALKFSLAGSKIEITAELDQDMVKFSVRDYGIGIASDKLDKVFERFYQVDGSTTRRYRGTGLGLAIVKQIVEAHKGRIIVESEMNEGTTFTFWLPIYEETAKVLSQ